MKIKSTNPVSINITAIAGIGNSFKSTISHYIMLTAADRLNYSLKNDNKQVTMHTYDTENNMVMNLDRINSLSVRMKYIKPEPLFNPDTWSYIMKADMNADDWLDLVYKAAEEKKKDKSNKMVYTCFVNRITNKPLEVKIPSFIEIDSFSEFESSKTTDVVERGDVDNSNTLFMQQGLFKTKVVRELPNLSYNTDTNFILTAHVGNEINMASGPYAPQPNKALQHVKRGQKIKGISDKLLFLSTSFWQAFDSSVFMNNTTKMPEYPRGKEDVATDLNIVKLKQLRSKSGPSGYVIEILVSQSEGVLSELSYFHLIKTNKYGLVGNNLSYSVAIYPEVKLGRTTVRSKIDNDPKLRNALTIIGEMYQMTIFMKQYAKYLCTPEELYTRMIERGYDWDFILSKTRTWHTPNQYKTELLPFSTLDILKAAAGVYEPYWFKKEIKEKK